MEMRLLLATILQSWTLHLVGAAPEPEALITLRPKGGLRMRAQARISGGRTNSHIPADTHTIAVS